MTARRRRLDPSIRPVLSESLDLVAPWFNGAGHLSADDALDVLSEASTAEQLRSLSILGLEVRLHRDEHIAEAQGLVITSPSQPDDLHAWKLGFRVTLQEQERTWRITRVTLEEPAMDLPEARP